MASTNHTANYSLSQFAQTDKPAWLGDYNQDMTKIDTAMKNNADATTSLGTTVSGHTTAISGLTTDVASVQSDVTSLGTRVTAVETKNTEQDTAITSAQTKADNADAKADVNAGIIAQHTNDITSINADIVQLQGSVSDVSDAETETAGKLDDFIDSFAMSNIVTKNRSDYAVTSFGSLYGGGIPMTLAQNSVGSMFKFYGYVQFGNSATTTQTISKTAVTGLSGYYGFKTNFKLTTAPTNAYAINGAGIQIWTVGSRGNLRISESSAIAVDTEGYVYIDVDTSNTRSCTGSTEWDIYYPPSLFTNIDFGDAPTPPEA